MSYQKPPLSIKETLKVINKYLKSLKQFKNRRFFFIMATFSIYLKLYQCLRLNQLIFNLSFCRINVSFI